MRPEGPLLLGDGGKIQMAALAGNCPPFALSLDQRRRTKPGAGSGDEQRPAIARQRLPNRQAPVILQARQRERLRLKIIEHQTLRQPQLPGNLAPFNHPSRIGQLDPCPLARPGRAEQNGPWPGGLWLPFQSALNGLGQAGEVRGAAGGKGLQRGSGGGHEARPNIGAADITDKEGEGDMQCLIS